MLYQDSNPKNKKVSVLGCGWLGLSFAQYLQGQGYEVKGSKTTLAGVEQLEALGLEAYVVALEPTMAIPKSPFWDAQTLVIAIPPQRGASEEYLIAQIEPLIQLLLKSPVKHVLYVSSTSVYADSNGIVTEEEETMPDKTSGIALRKIEQVLLRQTAFSTTVLRFGGLIGYDREPNSAASILARKRSLDSPMNVIHRDDCLRIMAEIIRQGVWAEIFNACADEHPSRREYYALAAQAKGFACPDLGPVQELPYKIISSEKLKAALGYQFIYSNPLQLFQANEAGTT